MIFKAAVLKKFLYAKEESSQAKESPLSFEELLELEDEEPRKSKSNVNEEYFNIGDMTELFLEGLRRASMQINLLWVNYMQLLEVDSKRMMYLLKVQYEHYVKEKIVKQRVNYKFINSISLAMPLDYDELETMDK
jgi:hypothetical protein